MIVDAEIVNFKGISECKIDDLSRINLFIGKNNTCKSTILEGLYYALKEFTGTHLNEILARRSNVSSSATNLWYDYQTDETIVIGLNFEKAHIELALSFDEAHRSVTSNLAIKEERTNVSQTHVGGQYSSDLLNISSITFGGDILKVLSPDIGAMIMNYAQNCSFLESSGRKDVSSTEEILGNIKHKGKAEEFGKYLSSVFDIGRLWEFLPSLDFPGEYRAAAMIDGKPLFLTGLGDGFRYAMQIVGKTLLTDNVGVFIEEIESNQHPASLRKLIDFLVETSFQNNLQLFITTHSDVAARYFMYHFRKEENRVDPRAQNMRYFHVRRDRTTGKVDCPSIDIMNATDQNKVMADLFELE